jgi:hypothetical protein
MVFYFILYSIFILFKEPDWIAAVGISRDQIHSSIVEKLPEITKTLKELYEDQILDNSLKISGILAEKHGISVPQATKFMELVDKALKGFDFMFIYIFLTEYVKTSPYEPQKISTKKENIIEKIDDCLSCLLLYLIFYSDLLLEFLGKGTDKNGEVYITRKEYPLTKFALRLIPRKEKISNETISFGLRYVYDGLMF